MLSIIPQADLSSSGSLQMVGIDVIDSGLGMTEDFIKEQLFIPFKQQDSFSSGAGLGVSSEFELQVEHEPILVLRLY